MKICQYITISCCNGRLKQEEINQDTQHTTKILKGKHSYLLFFINDFKQLVSYLDYNYKSNCTAQSIKKHLSCVIKKANNSQNKKKTIPQP